MRPFAPGLVSTTVMVTDGEEADVFVRDHASEVEPDRAGNLNSNLGILGEVVPPETIPDFLEPMPEEELGTWENTDEPELGPA